MTRKIVLAATLAMLAAGAVPAAAEGPFIPAQTATEYLAKDRLIGAKVHDSSGKIVADIEDLIIDGDNKVVGVVMGVGGVLGLGEKKVGVVLSALGIEATETSVNVVMPTATKEALEAAPAFERAKPKKGWLQRAVEKGEEFKDKTKDAYEKAKEQAGPALEKAKEAAKSVIEKAQEAAHPSETAAPAPATPAPAEAPKN